jgi:hypothetical protein
MDWIEDMVSDLLSLFPEARRDELPLLRLSCLAKAVDSGLFKRLKARQLKDAFRTELNQYIAAGGIPANRKRTEEIVYHHRRLNDLALLIRLPMNGECRRMVSGAISDEGFALGDSYQAWIDHMLDR